MPELIHNAQTVKSLKAIDGKRTQYRSALVVGLELDCQVSGQRTWRVRYRVGRGVARKFRAYKIGDADNVSLGQAVDKAREILSAVQVEGRDPHRERATGGDTLSIIVEKWTEWQRNNGRRTWKRNRDQFELHVRRALGSKPVADITRRDVAELLDKITETAGGKAANRTQALVSAALSYAVDEGFIEANPIFRLRRRSKETARNRKLTQDEIRAIWKATYGGEQTSKEVAHSISPQIGRVIRCLLLTGQRRSEVCQLPKTEIAREVWTISKDRTKNKLAHEVPLSRTAAAELAAAAQEHEWSPFVFQARLRTPKPMNATTPSASFAEMARELKIADVRLHDLRHVVATEMRALGVPADIVERVQNQITGQKRSIGWVYDQHEYFAEKLRALTLWEQRLIEIVENRPPSGLHW